MERVDKIADRGAWLSIIAYIFLSFFKLSVSIVTNSEALRADGLNNLTDIIASVAVLIGLKLARRPADEDHLYGHARIEQIASLVASFVMITVGIQVVLEACKSFFIKEVEQPDLLAAVVAAISAICMYFVYRYNRNLGKKLHSTAIMAVAKDNLSDALVSMGAVIGIIGANFGFYILDPITAFIVGIVIIKTAWDIFRESTHMLTDGFQPEILEQYRKTIETIEGIKDIRSLRGRLYGNRVYVDVVIAVNGDIDTIESHKIADDVEKLLKEQYQVLNTFVHIEPL